MRRMSWSRVAKRGRESSEGARMRGSDGPRHRRRQRPEMRADVAEPFVRVQCFEHRRIVAPAFGATKPVLRRPSGPPIASRTSVLGSSTHAAIASAAFLPQTVHVHQPQPHPAVRLDAAQPVRHLHVDRREADAVALRILDQRRRMVEPHRLVVEHAPRRTPPDSAPSGTRSRRRAARSSRRAIRESRRARTR